MRDSCIFDLCSVYDSLARASRIILSVVVAKTGESRLIVGRIKA